MRRASSAEPCATVRSRERPPLRGWSANTTSPPTQSAGPAVPQAVDPLSLAVMKETAPTVLQGLGAGAITAAASATRSRRPPR
jgi:hypothetical protein